MFAILFVVLIMQTPSMCVSRWGKTCFFFVDSDVRKTQLPSSHTGRTLALESFKILKRDTGKKINKKLKRQQSLHFNGFQSSSPDSSYSLVVCLRLILF